MHTPELAYFQPGSVDEALALLAEWGPDARLLSGGMSLMPALNLGTTRVRALISLCQVPGLRSVTAEDGLLRIGARTTHADLARLPVVRETCRMLADAADGLADVQVRNRGTVGGSLATAYPGAEYPTVLSALGADVHTRGPRGERRIPVAKLIVGSGQTVLAPDEMIVAVTVPLPVPARMAYLRYSRIQGNYSTVNVAAVLDDGGGRLAIGGATPRPVVVPLTPALVDGGAGHPSDSAGSALMHAASAACADACDDHLASARYRRHLAGVLARRIVDQARANGEGR
jgi:aerobic carbon-monoxide dehydrogenase medium subunit